MTTTLNRLVFLIVACLAIQHGRWLDFYDERDGEWIGGIYTARGFATEHENRAHTLWAMKHRLKRAKLSRLRLFSAH